MGICARRLRDPDTLSRANPISSSYSVPISYLPSMVGTDFSHRLTIGWHARGLAGLILRISGLETCADHLRPPLDFLLGLRLVLRRPG